MKQRDRKQQKERQIAALERIYRKFTFRSRAEMRRAMNISRNTLHRAMNHSDPWQMSNGNRMKVARFLGRQCTSEEELRALVNETEWEMREREWEEARAYIVGDEQVLCNVPRLSAGLMVGRTKEIESLCTWLLDERKTVERVLVMQGVGGVGKTMLAIHVARQRTVWEWYQDGVFWVDVERYEETSAIQWLAYKVVGKRAVQAKDPWNIVAEALKEKRILIVLDGVEEQIDLDRWTDLLPQKGRLLVTTRGTEMESARVGVRVLRLIGLTPDAARELLTRGARVDVTEGESARVMDGLERLPLALYIGNRIARLDGGLSGFVGDLREMGLEALALGSRKGENVRTAFEVSYGRLNEKRQMLFRGLGVSLPWFEAKAVAAVLGMSEVAVRRGLRRLMQVGLVDNVGPGEYRMHNLVYQYAAELGQADERWKVWQERFAAYYLELARKADAAWDLEMMGEHLAEISQGMICALALRDREMVMDYVRCAGVYVSLDESAAETWQEWATGSDDVGERAEMALREARFCQGTGQPEKASKLVREARDVFEETERKREWVDASLVTGETLLAMGHIEEVADGLRERSLWDRMAQLDNLDDLSFRAWALNEHVRVALGRDVGCEERAEAARTRWLAGQPSSKRAQLRLLRSVPLNEDAGEAMRVLEERMALAEKVGKIDWWITDALQRGSLLVQQGKVVRTETALKEIEERDAEVVDNWFWPWVCLLRAQAARAAGRDEEAEQEYRAAAEALADVFGETVFWLVDREGIVGETAAERAVEVWQRALRVDDPFRHVEAACRAYPLFSWSGEDPEDEEGEDLQASYQAAREEMKPMGLELPEWDWLVAEDAAAEEEPPEKHQRAVQS